MTIATLQTIAELSGGRLINCVLAGTVIALLAWIVLRVTNCRNSGTRFAVWFSALLAIAGLSFVSFTAGGSGSRVADRIPHIALPASWLWYAFLIWATVACFGLLRIAISLAQVWSLRWRSRELAKAEIDPLLLQTLNDFYSRRVKLCVSDDLRVPAAVGFVTPAVIIPRWALEELSAGELNAVLLHELGHLSRWDDWTNLAQKVLRAVLFFHPVVWWIDSRLTLEREMACDDLVLARTSDARGYAQCLVSVAEKSLLRTGLALALAAVSRMRQTTARLARILDPTRLNETRVSKPALAGVTAASLIAFVVLPHTPRLVVFENAAPVASIANVAAAAPLVRQASFKQASAKPKVIEASERVEQPHVVNAVLKNSSSPERRMQKEMRAVGARGKTAQSSSPRVVRTSMKSPQSAGPTLLFVVQIEEFDGTGVSTWSVRVLRVSITIDQREIQAQNGTIVSSI